MLQVWEIHNRQSINDWLEKLDISKQTWLLSDLRTKFEIQELFIQKRGFFLEESVLRISDLWKKVLLRSNPEYKIITQQAAILHLRFFLRLHGESIGLPESSENTLLKWMTDLAPFYFHPDGEEKLSDWFLQNPDQEESWKDWWLRAKATFSYFKNKKLLLPQWIKAFLQSIQDISSYCEKDLFVDLSSQLSFVEAELLYQLSKTQNVTVLAPHLLNSKSAKYSDLLQPYEYLKGFAQKNEKIKSRDQQGCQREYSSFSSTLGSLRQTTSIVRKWIEQGIALDQIAIVAPDIESIWPVLSFHLEVEGIPVNKSKLSSFQASVAVQHFLSKLRALNYNLSMRDLELSYYSPTAQDEQKIDLAFERFEALYKNIYDESDYTRFEKIKNNLKIDADLKTPMNQAQFIFQISKLSASLASEEIPNWLEILVRDLLASFDESFLLPWSDWVSFCESCLSRHEVMQQEAAHNGIMVTNIMSAHFLKVTHRIFLELSEENLKAKSDRGIMPQAARKISQDLGFWLSHSEQGDLEFELEWAIQCGLKADHLFYGAINLTGQIMTPSSVWLKAKNIDRPEEGHAPFQIPEKTVLDSVLGQTTESMRLLQDLGEKAVESLGQMDVKFLSPSALEAFHKCPFTYFARQTLGLKTFPEIDLDLDRRSAGEALHYLFEVILSKGLAHWSDEQLEMLLEETRTTHFTGVVEGLWLAQKKKMIKLCQRFIQFETEWRRNHPNIKTTKTEVSWSGQIQGANFRGRIDRVDISDKNDIIVIDYKLSGSQLKGAHQWIENGSLQMLFYMYALEHGWAAGIEGQVVAAFYFVVKNFSRETGFELDEEIPGFLHPTKKRNQKLNDEKKLELMEEFEILVESLTARLQSGEIKPLPTDESFCVKCDWRRLCRAPHLA